MTSDKISDSKFILKIFLSIEKYVYDKVSS